MIVQILRIHYIWTDCAVLCCIRSISYCIVWWFLLYVFKEENEWNRYAVDADFYVRAFTSVFLLLIFSSIKFGFYPEQIWFVRSFFVECVLLEFNSITALQHIIKINKMFWLSNISNENFRFSFWHTKIVGPKEKQANKWTLAILNGMKMSNLQKPGFHR